MLWKLLVILSMLIGLFQALYSIMNISLSRVYIPPLKDSFVQHICIRKFSEPEWLGVQCLQVYSKPIRHWSHLFGILSLFAVSIESAQAQTHATYTDKSISIDVDSDGSGMRILWLVGVAVSTIRVHSYSISNRFWRFETIYKSVHMLCDLWTW